MGPSFNVRRAIPDRLLQSRPVGHMARLQIAIAAQPACKMPLNRMRAGRTHRSAAPIKSVREEEGEKIRSRGIRARELVGIERIEAKHSGWAWRPKCRPRLAMSRGDGLQRAPRSADQPAFASARETARSERCKCSGGRPNRRCSFRAMAILREILE